MTLVYGGPRRAGAASAWAVTSASDAPVHVSWILTCSADQALETLIPVDKFSILLGFATYKQILTVAMGSTCPLPELLASFGSF